MAALQNLSWQTEGSTLSKHIGGEESKYRGHRLIERGMKHEVESLSVAQSQGGQRSGGAPGKRKDGTGRVRLNTKESVAADRPRH